MNDRMEKFVKFYNGDPEEAALKAGYSPRSAKSQGYRLLKKATVCDLIRTRQEREPRVLREIANRQERQEFWSKTMRNEEMELRDRLRASELLGKSEADFVERREVDMNATVNVFDAETRAKLLEVLGSD